MQCSSTSIPASVYSTLEPLPYLVGNPAQRPAVIRILTYRRADIQHRLQLG
jgi:hypothetical protein